MRSRSWLTAVLLGMMWGAAASAAAPEPPAAPKLNALLLAGACCHDHKHLIPLLAQKVCELASARFDIRFVSGIDELAAYLQTPRFAEPYDVIVYAMCYSAGGKDEDFAGALQAAAAGKPAVFIHCAVDSYRPSTKWRQFAGIDASRHEKYQTLNVVTIAAAKAHPILAGFPSEWPLAGDELYDVEQLMPGAAPLLTAASPTDGRSHVVAWAHQYGKARVFGTTLGHDRKTCADPRFHQLLARGLLWACDKLDPDAAAPKQ